MIVLVPGMGSYHLLFSWRDLPGLNPKVLQLCPPGEWDSLGGYAKILQPQITSTEDAVLLGVALGGMLAVELARLARFRKIILISSAKTCLEIPFYFRKAGKAGWHRWITADRLVRMRQKISPLMNRLGAEYRTFRQMVRADRKSTHLNSSH